MKRSSNILAAVLLCGTMLVSGCGGNNNASGTTSQTEASAAPAANNASKPARPTEAQFVKSTDPGNSGDVKLESGDTYAVISIKDYGDITVKLYPDEAPYAVYNFVELAKAGTYNGRNFHRIVENFMAQGGSANGEGSGGDSFEGGNFRNEINTSLRHYYGAFCYGSAMGNMSDQFYIVNSKKKPETDLKDMYSQYMNMYLQYAQAFKQQFESLDQSDPNNQNALAYYALNNMFYCDYLQGAQDMAETITDAVKDTYDKKGGCPALDGGYTVFGQTVDGFDVIDKITAVEKTTGNDGAVSKPVTDIIIDKVEIFTK